jgi:integrase
MRGKGEGAVFRVPADRSLPLKYWQGSIELPSLDGKRRRKVVRSKSKAQVIKDVGEQRAELQKRGDLPTAHMTVEQWFTYWLNNDAKKSVRPKTWHSYEWVVRLHVVPVIGHVKLEKLTVTNIRKVHDTMTGNGLSSTYALNAHRVMSRAFKVAVREGKMGRNPAEMLDAPRKALQATDALDLVEAIRVLEHVSHDRILGARWATSLLTGARRGEVIGLERDRVGGQLDLSWQLQRLKLTDKTGKPDVPADFEYRHLTGGLYLTRPKSTAGWRIIPLVDPLRSILERHIENTPDNPWGLVFTRPETDRANRQETGRRLPIDPDQDSAAWKLVLADVGIEKNVVLHGLRHTAIDLLYEAGVPEDLIMQIAGHSVRSVTRGYKTRGQDPRLVAAMEQFSSLFTTPTPQTPAAIED